MGLNLNLEKWFSIISFKIHRFNLNSSALHDMSWSIPVHKHSLTIREPKHCLFLLLLLAARNSHVCWHWFFSASGIIFGKCVSITKGAFCLWIVIMALFLPVPFPRSTRHACKYRQFLALHAERLEDWKELPVIYVHDFFFLHKPRRVWTRLLNIFLQYWSFGMGGGQGYFVSKDFMVSIGGMGRFVPVVIMVERGDVRSAWYCKGLPTWTIVFKREKCATGLKLSK